MWVLFIFTIFYYSFSPLSKATSTPLSYQKLNSQNSTPTTKCPIMRSIIATRSISTTSINYLKSPTDKENNHTSASTQNINIDFESENFKNLSWYEKIKAYGKTGTYLWMALNLSLTIFWYYLAKFGYADRPVRYVEETFGKKMGDMLDIPGFGFLKDAREKGMLSEEFIKCYLTCIFMQMVTRPVRIPLFLACLPKTVKLLRRKKWV